MAGRNAALDNFLKPLRTNQSVLHRLTKEFVSTFESLAANSTNQFLPTPVFESTLRPCRSRDKGLYLAIDIGGSFLRVAFVQLFPPEHEDKVRTCNKDSSHGKPHRHLTRLHEHMWPILNHLKNENAEQLFEWIGSCITQVIQAGQKDTAISVVEEIPMGVTFSFPMTQDSLTRATLMPMGKGFAITSNLDLGFHLIRGYEKNRGKLPRIRITAILNDAVATLVSFMYQYPETDMSKPAMGIILGTGSNATIPMKLSSLHESKRNVQYPSDQVSYEDAKIAVNTEWSINGSLAPLEALGLITKWDIDLDAASEMPGFQPLEYMTAGRYLGELCRLIFVDYLTNVCQYNTSILPVKIKTRFSISTTFLSSFRPEIGNEELVNALKDVIDDTFPWTENIALDLYQIVLTVEKRASFIIAAAIIGLLQSAGYMPSPEGEKPAKDILVGYTGGCITNFQNYLEDTRRFISEILEFEYGAKPPVQVLLLPYHEGGIEGAGILAAISHGYSDT